MYHPEYAQNHTNDYIWFLKFRISVQERELESYRNGNKFKKLEQEYESLCRKKDAKIKELEQELAKAHAGMVSMRKAWSEVFDDVYKECSKEIAGINRQLLEERKTAVKALQEIGELKEKLKERKKKYYDIGSELEEEKGKNKKLTAQVNRDFQNSSIPSSQQGMDRKPIPNCREKTGRRPGGQTGHEGHRLLQRRPTEVHMIPDPEEYKNDPDYRETNDVVKRQKIFLEVRVKVVEYQAKVFRNIKTGSKVHATFPEGYEKDISYDGTVKAAMFLLNNECNVSLGKTRRYWSELTGGQLEMSTGKINSLTKEFAGKTREEKQEIYEKLMRSPFLNVDFTNANVNGKTKQVLIIASPSADVAMYYGRDHKGHKGIVGTPVEIYVGTLGHDHDPTFYSYGMAHQECMQHNCRYITGSEENEPDYAWNKKMHGLFKRMLKYRRELGEEPIDEKMVKNFEDEYDLILALAKEEYENEPPNEYYREGYNLYRRLVEYKDSELLFLHDKNVPPDNSLAERLARIYKRKQKQAIVLRSDESFRDLCEDLGVLYSLKNTAQNLYEKVSSIFKRAKNTENAKEA